MKTAQILALSTLFVALTACFGSGDQPSEGTSDEPAAECIDDTQRCSDDDSAIEQCIDGAWQTWTDCDGGCSMSEGEAECDEIVAG